MIAQGVLVGALHFNGHFLPFILIDGFMYVNLWLIYLDVVNKLQLIKVIKPVLVASTCSFNILSQKLN